MFVWIVASTCWGRSVDSDEDRKKKIEGKRKKKTEMKRKIKGKKKT